MELEIEDQLFALAKTVKVIEFLDYSCEEETLEALIDGNENIIFDFPLVTISGKNKKSKAIWPSEYPDRVNARIRAAHIQTDSFIDSTEFYPFSNLVHLSLSVASNNAEYYDDNEIADLWDVLINLADLQLKTITFNLTNVSHTAATQIKELFANPYNVVELQFLERKKGNRSS